ncbi:TetR/AcrR family transcriptional regulator [Yinghuangia seranimata]|uniref:TetR/AcrR family transcriptional regulator n=1 Tax=Yinghuangia seranimata TaxID=408067 RepID=UPI00248C9034|nr:TetR/AcrR family transcriptional regulator [Yinghuangia seranimata]MDI2130515.1 TetR/AcrR family transcriptional regulator [Yinghuangia seranimata]
MGRKPNPERRAEILRAVVDELARTGLGDLSLRPLAGALGVSTYTLTYQFGSKEELLRAVLEFVEAEQVGAARVAGGAAGGDVGATVAAYWQWVTEPARLGRVRLVFEALTIPRVSELLPQDFRARLMSAWVDLLAGDLTGAGVAPEEAEAEATVAASALAGMLLDLLATGDRERLGRAAQRLARRLGDLQVACLER